MKKLIDNFKEFWLDADLDGYAYHLIYFALVGWMIGISIGLSL